MMARVSDDRPAWRKQLEQSFAEIEALGRQVGSTLGASHEAKEAWHKLEPRIEHVRGQVEGKLREVGGEAAEHLEGVVAELRSSLEALRKKL